MRKSMRAPRDSVGAFLERAEQRIHGASDAELERLVNQLRSFLVRPLGDGHARWQANRLLERAEHEQLDRIFRP
jgi:hypothetical protein